jgi:DNA-binding LacI/PurR family transcriptional regulator
MPNPSSLPTINLPKIRRKKVAILTSFLRIGQWRGIMRYGQQAGWICQRIDRDTLARLNTWEPDALLFQIDEFDTQLLDFVINSKLPKVGLRALPGPGNETPLVLRDLTEFGHNIATHFVARNYRRLCYIGPKSNATANAGCTHVKGMQQVADAHGIQLECFYPDHKKTWKSLGLTHRRRSSTDWDRFWEMGSAVIDHLTKDSEPVAVFSAYCEPAMEFMEMIDERNLSIPSQIGIAAQSEDALNGLVTKVPMTCLVPDHEKQSFQAAQLLDKILDGRKIDNDHRIFISEFELVLRESSNQIVTSDPLLEQMLEHVRENALEAFYTPDALATKFGYSLRAVQIRFRTALGRGIAEIIREERTQLAIELILKSNLPMQEIYGKCGFSGHHQLERAVRFVHGVGPSALRKRNKKNAAPAD